MKNLTEIKEGQTVVIDSYSLCCGFGMRLMEMGLLPGTKITVFHNRGRGPVVVKVKEAKISLGHSLSKKVNVRQVPDE